MMTLNSSILSTIQKTGALAHRASQSLHEARHKAAASLAKALTLSSGELAIQPTDLADINTIAKLAARVDAIEQELRSVYQAVEAIVVAPAKTAAATKPKATAVAAKVKPLKGRGRAKVVKVKFAGNTAKLMDTLASILSAEQYQPLKQTDIAKRSGIPLGSITSSLKKLLALGKITTNHAGGYQLSAEAVAAAAPSAPSDPAKKATSKKVEAPAKPKKLASKKTKPTKPAKAVATKSAEPKASQPNAADQAAVVDTAANT